MIKRKFWHNRIELLWRDRSVLCLSGVRRVGKTVLAQTLPQVDYYDCELPSTRNLIADPEDFLNKRKGQRIVLDEIHRLDNPSEILKIAADHYTETKVLTTGSSALTASQKFKDTLAGRKNELWLTPLITQDLYDFARINLKHRFLFGGLPPFFLSKKIPEKYFQEWVDAFWAKDIQELFRLERRNSFQKFLELLMVQSGGVFEANSFAAPCGVSHTTIANYLSVLEETYVVHVLRPFSSYKKTEIVAAPKVYAFDTGFVCYYRGIHDLKDNELGQMWEHYVLNEIQARIQLRLIRYWRDKQKHEVDFIIERRGRPPLAIEAKWSSKTCDFTSLRTFLHQYPRATAVFVCNDLTKTIKKHINGFTVIYTGLKGLLNYLREVDRT